MSHDLVAELAAVPLLAGLPTATLAGLASAGGVRNYAPGAVLWRTGAEPTGLFVVLEGQVTIVRGRDGRQHVVHRAGPGATIGEVPLLAGGGYPASAVAGSQVRCFVVELEVLRGLAAGHPDVAWRLLQHLARRVAFLVERLDERSGTAVRERVQQRLDERSQAAGGGWFRLRDTQAGLAEEVGSVREVIVRILRDLRQEGLLETDGRGRYRLTAPASDPHPERE